MKNLKKINSNINSVLKTLYIKNNFSVENICSEITQLCNVNLTINNNNIYFYNLFLYKTLKKNCNIKSNFILNYNANKLCKTILYVAKTSCTHKKGIINKYKIFTCIGLGQTWVGIGEGKNKLYGSCYTKSINAATKYIYNLNFDCNDYKQLKYKGYKFKAVNTVENKYNLKIYDNITKISGIKKVKLISNSSKTPINVLKSFMLFGK